MDGTKPGLESISLQLHGASITPQTFRKSIDCFFDIVNEVVRDFPSAQGQVGWTVAVTAGSANIHLTAHSISESFGLPRIHELVGAIHNGIQTIESSSVKPPYFSDYALRKTKELASIVLKGGIDSMDIGWKGSTTSVTPKTYEHIRSVLGIAYKSWGSVEGVLCEVSEKGRRKFVLYDDVTENHITCHFSAELLPDVLRDFGKRISAVGLVSYRSDTSIKSISVDHFTRFPARESLPSFSEIYGMLRNVE